MRKLLLATVAATSASLGMVGFAAAQSATADVGSASMADGQAAAPAPGTITVRLNGRFRFYAGLMDDQQFNTGGNKQADYGTGEYVRLYPGFDGVAANGLKYGAAIEIRQDNTAAPGGGINGSISASDRGRAALYYRREFGYLGTDKLGTIRVGATDNPSSLYITGTGENYNDGGWNGDVPMMLAGNAQLTWPFADVGALYSTSKIVYLSPQIFGFDFGVSYEPNTGTVGITNGNCSAASASSGVDGPVFGTGVGTGCDRLSSTTSGDTARRRNTLDALLRYRGTFGPAGVAVTGSYIHSAKVDNDGTPPTGVMYDGLDVGDVGAAVTFGGLSIQGNYEYGRMNGQWNLDPSGAPSGQAWIAGASYTFGPLIVGANYIDYTSQGDNNLVNFSQRRDRGVQAGGTYSLAPGVALFLSYLWDERKQSGFNFVTGADSGTTATQNNAIRAQLVTLGTSFTW